MNRLVVYLSKKRQALPVGTDFPGNPGQSAQESRKETNKTGCKVGPGIQKLGACRPFIKRRSQVRVTLEMGMPGMIPTLAAAAAAHLSVALFTNPLLAMLRFLCGTRPCQPSRS